MKHLNTFGISYFQLLEGSHEWYWGTNHTGGDLYEASELYHHQPPLGSNRLIFIHYPDGHVVQPLETKDGQYFGRPIYFDNKLTFLLADFTANKIQIFQYQYKNNQLSTLAEISLSEIIDCYNLLLHASPLMLTRQGADHLFQIIWPEKVEFQIGDTESFCCRADTKLYFTAWYEDPHYREELIIREYATGNILEKMPGSLLELPDGQKWRLY